MTKHKPQSGPVQNPIAVTRALTSVLTKYAQGWEGFAARGEELGYDPDSWAIFWSNVSYHVEECAAKLKKELTDLERR